MPRAPKDASRNSRARDYADHAVALGITLNPRSVAEILAPGTTLLTSGIFTPHLIPPNPTSTDTNGINRRSKGPGQTPTIGPRKTRSNKEFSPWDLCHLTPQLDFDGLIQAKVLRDLENGDGDQEPVDEEDSGGEEEQEGGGSWRDEESSLAGPSQPLGPSPPNSPSPFASLSESDEDEPLSAFLLSSPLNPPVALAEETNANDPPFSGNKKRKGNSPSKRKQKKAKGDSAPQEDSPPPTNHKKRRNASSHASRAKKRANAEFGDAAPRQSIKERYADGNTTVDCATSLEETKVTSTGFVGLHDDDGTRTVRPLEYFVGEDSKMKFTLQHWDGRTPTLLIDKNRRLVGVLAGHPDDPEWSEVHDEAVKAMEAARPICDRHEKRPGRRGAFVSVRCGVSHGGGQKQPSNMNNTPEEEEVLEKLNGMEFFHRVSSFSSSVMATRAPKLYKYYSKRIGKLYKKTPRLRRRFRRSIFCGTTYNLGPRTVCFKHRDGGNLAFGWCAITPLGTFDHTAGRHLVLWECRLVIEFPPGSTILIPSAVVAHSNTAIGPQEQQYSFTQYTAGSLFRWVENKFQSATAYRESLNGEQLQKVKEEDAKRWKSGLSLLPIIPVQKSKSNMSEA